MADTLERRRGHIASRPTPESALLRRRAVLRLFLAGAGGAAATALLAACGGAAATSTTAPTALPTATSAPAAATPAPAAAGAGLPSGGTYSTLEPVGRRGGQIVRVNSNEAATTNPMLSNTSASHERIDLMFSRLVQVNPDTVLPFPDLATEVPSRENGGISADGLTYTFKLRRDVKWHDGTPFTAKDVVFTYTTMANKDLGSTNTGLVTNNVEAVTAPDDFTAVFRVKKAFPGFLVTTMFGIAPQHILGSVPVDQIKSHPFSTGDPRATIGTGPFLFREWVKDDHATLVKNPAYFRGEPALDQVVYRVVRDATVAVQVLKSGEVDWGVITEALYDDISKQANLGVSRFFDTSMNILGFQLDAARTPLFQDRRVRQALAHGMDREAMIRAVRFGFAVPSLGTVTPATGWAYAPEKITVRYPYDRQRAEQLLDDAGWRRGADGIRAKDGQRLSFGIHLRANSTQAVQYATILQQQWRAIGVELTPQPEESNAFVARVTQTHDFEAYFITYAYVVDPDQTNFWSCGAYTNGANLGRYCNPQVDDLLSRALVEFDQEKRRQLLVDFQNALLADLPAIIFEFPEVLVATSKRLRNVFPNRANNYWNAHLWWVADGR